VTALRAGWIAVALLVAAAARCAAQEPEVFKIDDFILPSELQKDGQARSFVVSRAFFGYDRQYSNRDNQYGQNVKFLQVAGNVYHDFFQLHVDATKFWADAPTIANLPTIPAVPEIDRQGVPDLRIRVEPSFYFDDTTQDAGRFRLRWSTERLSSGRYVHEFGADLSVKVATEFYGGFFYSSRPSQQTHVFGMGYDYDVWRDDNGVAVTLGFDLVGEVAAGDWRWGVSHLRPALRLPIAPHGLYAYFVYSMGKSFSAPRADQVDGINHEASVFLSVPVFSKLSSTRPVSPASPPAKPGASVRSLARTY
jgi:hypothetical protein